MSAITASIAQEAIEMADPAIRGILTTWGSREDFHLIVSQRVGTDGFTILAEQSYGDTEACARKYRPIALGKTQISAQTGKDSRLVQLMEPWLLDLDSDVIYWGSKILDDIIVAGSGVQAYWDETIAKIVLAIILGILQHLVNSQRVNAEQTSSFRFSTP